MEIKTSVFGETNGKSVEAYMLNNNNGMTVTCISYGCIITEIVVADKNNKMENVVLGFDNLSDYMEQSTFFGAVVGRVAGRIANGEFELDGHRYKLPRNDNQNHLHGGYQGFDKLIWDAAIFENENEVAVEFSYMSEDGEEGYPGNLHVKVTYTLNNNNELLISYEGISDKKTMLNLTNHTYFNLNGDCKRNILNHSLKMESEQFLELNDELIPTGQFLEVKNTKFDFRKGRKIADGVDSSHPQNILAGNGYDHPFLLKKMEIELIEQESGRKLVILTDQPAVVLYTGNQLKHECKDRGISDSKYLGLCLETQGLPDSIHHPHFDSCILDKGEVYQAKTIYQFTVVDE